MSDLSLAFVCGFIGGFIGAFIPDIKTWLRYKREIPQGSYFPPLVTKKREKRKPKVRDDAEAIAMEAKR